MNLTNCTGSSWTVSWLTVYQVYLRLICHNCVVLDKLDRIQQWLAHHAVHNWADSLSGITKSLKDSIALATGYCLVSLSSTRATTQMNCNQMTNSHNFYPALCISWTFRCNQSSDFAVWSPIKHLFAWRPLAFVLVCSWPVDLPLSWNIHNPSCVMKILFGLARDHSSVDYTSSNGKALVCFSIVFGTFFQILYKFLNNWNGG